jgi:hypothetical protein
MGSRSSGEGRALPRQRPGEPRWPSSLAVTAAIVLSITLPEKLTAGPGWVIPSLEGALVVTLTLTAPYRLQGEVRLIRLASLLLIGLVNLANLVSLALLVHVVVSGGLVSGRTLIFSGIQIWLTLILVFALWYWEIDRGGPTVRGHSNERSPDFLFPQMATPELQQPSWMARSCFASDPPCA